MADDPEPPSKVSVADMGRLIAMIKGYEKTLGPNGGFGDWRPELRNYITEVSGQIRSNFDTHSAAGAAFAQVERRSMLHWTNPAMRSTQDATVDEGRAIPASAAEAHRKNAFKPGKSGHLSGSNVRGWRGLRDIASNISEDRYPGLSLYRMAKLSVTIGVVSGDEGVPYAAAHLARWRGRPARNYMALSGFLQRDALRELVVDGVEARMKGYRDFRGSMRDF